MRVTKFVHACLLVETPERAALFDPGSMSVEALAAATPGIKRLDDIFITHIHHDHCSPEALKPLVAKFPDVRITTTPETVAMLAEHGIRAADRPPQGAAFFEAPHESLAPNPTPQNTGIHYLDRLSDPGDSHSFHETKPILALPVTAPWGSANRALNLALELKPRHVLPIHDWHWNDKARATAYGQFERTLGQQGITFHKLETGQPIEVAV